MKVLLTGASGYVGGRLRAALEQQSHQLRCLARQPENLRGRVAASTEVVRGDVEDKESLERALDGMDVAYYLVHSMGSRRNFEERDRHGAHNFAEAACAAGVRRIIYVGALVGEEQELSAHMRSRVEVGRILRESGIPTIELRASIVIGAGSLSFELVRALVERLPVMVTPTWTKVEAQPIAIRDLVAYLLACLDLEISGSRIYEIGGADRASYEGLMREYARQRSLRRFILRVPVITPWLSSLWLGLITPVYSRVGRKLIESIRHPTVVNDEAALRDFDVRPMSTSAAIARALSRDDSQFIESRWYDSLSSGGEIKNWTGARFGNRIADRRSAYVDAPPDRAFQAIQCIGGATGWYAFNWLWSVRGAIDLLTGGVGVRRGRPHPSALHVGDALDFWRVEAFEPGHHLRLRAEMKVPGRAWLEFDVRPEGDGTRLMQTATFDPLGLWGLAYWYLVYPLHALVFRGMIKGLARAAQGRKTNSQESPSVTRRSTLPSL